VRQCTVDTTIYTFHHAASQALRGVPGTQFRRCQVGCRRAYLQQPHTTRHIPIPGTTILILQGRGHSGEGPIERGLIPQPGFLPNSAVSGWDRTFVLPSASARTTIARRPRPEHPPHPCLPFSTGYISKGG
jgi:hypothetical protein